MRRHAAIIASASLLALVGAAALRGVAVAAPPSNDDFADATVLVGLTAEIAGTNVEATGEPGEPNHAGVSEGPLESVWYSWTAPASSRFRIDTCTADFKSTLAVYTGSSVEAAALTEVVSNESHEACAFTGDDLGSLVEFDAVAGTTYRIAVDGHGGQEGTFTLTLAPTAGTGTLTVHKATCSDIAAPTLSEVALVARAVCTAGDASFEVRGIDPATGQSVVVARIQTAGGTGMVQLVAGNYDVAEVSPALVGPEPITLARDGTVTLVAENPSAAAGGGASPSATPTPAPTPRATMLSDTSVAAVVVAGQADSASAALVLLAASLFVWASACVWATGRAARSRR